jgi:hypothetical protein
MRNYLLPIPSAPDPVELDWLEHGRGPVDGRAVFDEYLLLADGLRLPPAAAFARAFENVLHGVSVLDYVTEENEA